MSPPAFGQSSAAVIDDRLPTPLYHQIYLVLRNKILDGEYGLGSLLPSEQQSAKQFGVSRITAKRALNDLAADGLVVRERGRGTRVTYRAASPPVKASVDGLLENLLAMGLKTKVSLREFGYVAASENVARALNCQKGDVVQRAVRVRRLEGEPFSYLTTFVPEDIGRSYSREDLSKKPLLTLLECDGIVISGAEQTITATLADADAAAALGVDLGSPLLRISRVVHDQTERPVEYIIGLYRPDRYQFRMRLSRVQNQDVRAWSPSD